MTIDNAAELHTTWAARFNAKDLDGMVALAEPGSVFVPQPGVVVEGEAVRLESRSTERPVPAIPR